MPIPPLLKSRYAYHFCSLNNVESILQHGLLSPNEKTRLRISHHSIAEEGIQKRRSEMDVPCGLKGKVHDYVPFYFCERSSMLQAVIRKRNIDQQFIIYFGVPITIIEKQPSVFTSASANTEPPPTFFDSPNDFAALNWKLIDTRKWKLSEEEKKLRMAELLVHTKVDPNNFSKIIVWNASIKDCLEEVYAKRGLKPPTITADTHFFYNKYPESPDESLITGPFFTKRAFQDAVKFVEQAGQTASAPHENIAALLEALRANPQCLPEVAELFGLKSDNIMHKEDAGDHTLSVVRELKNLPEFISLNGADKRLTELAAYLHDIGKGPKARWAGNGGVQRADPDHPIGSVKMLRRILTVEVTMIKPRSIRVLTKLICYHDLIGNIIGNGRDPEQLEEIAETERELDMLIALNLADVKAIHEEWFLKCRGHIPALRQRVLAKFSTTSAAEEE